MTRAHQAINVDKKQIVHFHKSNTSRQNTYPEIAYNWSIPNLFPQNLPKPPTQIQEVTQFKYLGIKLDQELTMIPLQQQIIANIKKK